MGSPIRQYGFTIRERRWPGCARQAQRDYSVDGSAEFKPEVMFDDGHSIWMRMPAKSQTWPVPIYKDHGDRVVGNFIAELISLFSSGWPTRVFSFP